MSSPIILGGRLQGIVTRPQILSSLLGGGVEAPAVQKAATCFPDQTVKEIGDKFIESPVNVLVVLGREDGTVQGIITLHDLIRAQAAVRE